LYIQSLFLVGIPDPSTLSSSTPLLSKCSVVKVFPIAGHSGAKAPQTPSCSYVLKV